MGFKKVEPPKQQSQRPSYKEVFTIVEREGREKPIWLRIGTAFENKDGSINVILDALPANMKLHVRDPQPRDGSES